MKFKSYKGVILSMACILVSSFPLLASDMSDAEALRERCEKEIKRVEICVVNFGDATEKSGLQEGQKKLKLGKLKITQSRYVDAIDIYKSYLRLQAEIYAGLAKKYIDRTQKLNDEIAEEFVDSMDKAKVDEYFKMAYRNLEDAKKGNASSSPVLAIEACRRAKKYSLGVYGLLSKPIPEKYKIDAADIEGKMAGR